MVTIRRTTEDRGNLEYQDLEGQFVNTQKVSWLTLDFVLEMYSCLKGTLHGVENSSKCKISGFN
jgi:hypothetical protein